MERSEGARGLAGRDGLGRADERADDGSRRVKIELRAYRAAERLGADGEVVDPDRSGLVEDVGLPADEDLGEGGRGPQVIDGLAGAALAIFDDVEVGELGAVEPEL